jgi:prolipoprotein diacylglyceryltransferase
MIVARLHFLRPGWGSYQVLGTAGYLAGLTLAMLLAARAGAPLSARLIIALAPPATFLVAVKVSERVFGHERIVFFEQLLATVGVSALALRLAGAPVAAGVDAVTLGVGTFLAFGRLGCLMVGCCYGRPAPWGIRYTPAHADAGFPRRWVGRPLFPIQAVDALLSAGLVVAGALALDRPGAAAALYFSGYAAGRFALELFRGDGARPYWLGLSEAQWTALLVAWGVWLLDGSHLAVAVALAAGAAALLLSRRLLVGVRYWLTCPGHVAELHELMLRSPAGAPARATSLGLRLSLRLLPGELRDYVLSHPRGLSGAAAAALARQLGLDAEIHPGATAGLVHVIAAPPPGQEAAAGRREW